MSSRGQVGCLSRDRSFRKFLLAGLLAGATVVPARATETIPDFSGTWAHFTWPDVEPPAVGFGPIMNRSRRAGVSDPYQLVGDYLSPILKPQAAEIVKAH